MLKNLSTKDNVQNHPTQSNLPSSNWILLESLPSLSKVKSFECMDEEPVTDQDVETDIFDWTESGDLIVDNPVEVLMLPNHIKVGKMTIPKMVRILGL